jgi:methylated-DNA-[protein]-cysteine S-methyltransferase
MLSHTVFNTDFGWVGILCSKDGIVSLVLKDRRERVIDVIEERISLDGVLKGPTTLLEKIEDDVLAYLGGKRQLFDYRVDLKDQSPFARRVLMVVRSIPYGEIRTYKWVAMRLSTSPRAVGWALFRNPIPIIIPCHRIIKEGGGLGGYSLGLDLKKKLLRLEGINA